jgi:hypothetical protein
MAASASQYQKIRTIMSPLLTPNTVKFPSHSDPLFLASRYLQTGSKGNDEKVQQIPGRIDKQPFVGLCKIHS